MPAVKAILLGFAWLYAHHFFAGIRYLLLDLHWGIAKEASRASARLVFVLGALATLGVAWRIW
jgi:succinate dehydrogenase / fumarate reductase cytochrome b subunit